VDVPEKPKEQVVPNRRGGALKHVLSWAAVFLPIILTVPWVLLLAPLKLIEDVFSIPSALAASVLLTLVLVAVKRRRVPRKWIILPLLCWLYECLPITLPGPLDNLLTVGGSGMVTFWAWARKTHLPWK
jgi:hypothetical protein